MLWLHEEEAVDAPYIQAVLAEFEAACETCTVAVPAKLRVLSLDVALQQGNTSQVHTRSAGGPLSSNLRFPPRTSLFWNDQAVLLMCTRQTHLHLVAVGCVAQPPPALHSRP